MWKTVKTTVGEPEARMIEELLAAYNIPVIVQTDGSFCSSNFWK